MAKKLIILAKARTGSNLLRSLINSSEESNIKGEILKDVKTFNEIKLNWKDTFSNTQQGSNKLNGFKLFYYHPIGNHDLHKALWKKITLDKELNFIHLQRKNYLDVLVSVKLANMSGEWKSIEAKELSNYNQLQFTLSPKECKEFFEKSKFFETRFSNKLKNHRVLDVLYEDLTMKTSETMERILNFLHLEQREVTSKLKKQNVRKRSEVINNYTELLEFFGNTEWKHLFD